HRHRVRAGADRSQRGREARQRQRLTDDATSVATDEALPMRVLIVEDEPRMADLIRRGLTSEGLAADVAGTGEDALWMTRAHEYDAIVLDVMLPRLDGFETC